MIGTRLETALRRRARQRAHAAMRRAWSSALPWIFLGLPVFFVSIHESFALFGFGFLALVFLGSLLYVHREYRLAYSLEKAASDLDRAAGGRDLFSSALEFSRLKSPGPMMLLVIKQSEQAVEALDQSALDTMDRTRIRFPKAHILAGLTMALAVFFTGEPGNLFPSGPDFDQGGKACIEPVRRMVAVREKSDKKLIKALHAAADLLSRHEQGAGVQEQDEKEDNSKPDPGFEKHAMKHVSERIAAARAEHAFRVAEILDDPSPEATFKPKGRFDHDVSEMVSLMDAKLIRGKAVSGKKLEDMAQKVEDLAQKMSDMASFREGMQSMNPVGMRHTGGFSNEIQGLLRRSLAEFLKQYASTLRARAYKLMQEESRFKRSLAVARGGSLPKAHRTGLRSNQPPTGPAITARNPKEMKSPVAMKPPENATPMNMKGNSTTAGAKGAGNGKGPRKRSTDEGRAENYEYVKVKAQVGQGPSEFELLQEAAKGDIEESDEEVFTGLIECSASRAHTAMEQEPIPEDLKDIIKDYFEALSPRDGPDG